MPDASDQPEAASTAGWDAIAAWLERLYPGQTASHWGTVLPMNLGGGEPLEGISAYACDNKIDVPHWHYVSFGLSELYAKESEDAKTSGWGFEFTFRLKRQAGEDEPPRWPLGLLQNLAGYVFKTGNVFAEGHYLPLNGPIALSQETAIHAAMFTEDSELKKLDSPNGTLQFLQLVGITMEELAVTRAWNSERVFALMRQAHPLLVTDLARQSMTSDPSFARMIDEGTARDGSSTGSLAVRELGALESSSLFGGKSLTLVLGASGIGDIQALLRGRTPFGRDFHLSGPGENLVFSPGDRFGWEIKEKVVSIRLPGEAAQKLAAVLQPKRGEYTVAALPKLVVRVIPSKIMDATGKNVVQVIG